MIKNKNKNWGGVRLNAGLPRIEESRRILVTVNETQVQTALSLGDGNFSAGVRIALDQAKGTKPT